MSIELLASNAQPTLLASQDVTPRERGIRTVELPLDGAGSAMAAPASASTQLALTARP